MAGRLLNEKELIEVLQKRLPQAFKYASAYTLNELVFRAKKRFPDVVDKTMKRRNKSFPRKSSRVKKTQPGRSINTQRAIFYTRAIDRATGWVEQPVGGVDRRKRKWSPKARGSGNRSIPKKYRMLRGADFPQLNKKNKLGHVRDYVEKHNYFYKPVVVYENDNDIFPGLIRFSKKRITNRAYRGRRKRDGNAKFRMDRLFIRLAYFKKGRVEKVNVIDEAWKSIDQDVRPVWRDKIVEQLRLNIKV